MPGIDSTGSRRSSPCVTNNGYTRWPTDSSVSRTKPRRPFVCRSRLSRVAGKDIRTQDICAPQPLLTKPRDRDASCAAVCESERAQVRQGTEQASFAVERGRGGVDRGVERE